MSKGKVVGAVIAVLAVGGVAAALVTSGNQATEVQLAEVTREDLNVIVAAAGQVQADTRVDLYPPTAGTLSSIEVTEGDRVTAGQVIATMDARPIEVQLAQAEAAYAGAVAQRDAIVKSAPGSSDVEAAQAAVNVAWTSYSLANLRYEAALAGAGAPSAGDIADAQAKVALAQTNAETAKAAYDNFYQTVYQPADPKTPELETTLAVLALTRDQSAANLLSAQQALAALLAAADNTAAIAAAQVARDQAYAAYLGAVAQRDALSRATSVGSALNSADAAIEAADAARALTGDTLSRTQIVAPIDGIVLFNSGAASLLSASGASASGGGPTVGSSVSPAAAPFAVVSLETLAFTANVDEADIVRVLPGMKTLVELDGLADVTFAAEVDRVGIESVLTPTGGTAFPVRLVFSAAGESVLLGMNGSAEIAVDTVEDVITMPVEALLEGDGGHYVFTVEDGRARRTEIKIGQLTDTRVEVRSGLAEGDQVIVSGVSDLADGDRVRTE
ncbi:MAG: biotin/lipoyl-binding protein [Coriobacteriia bacterium]|nr:biotin/lipoyl-binding protein [Coriobacteriia bacterium]